MLEVVTQTPSPVVLQTTIATTLPLVRKRSGEAVPFEAARIHRAIEKAFRADQGIRCGEVFDKTFLPLVENLCGEVIVRLLEQQQSLVELEAIQDLVEQVLMSRGHYSVARKFIVYREEHRKARELHREFSQNLNQGTTNLETNRASLDFIDWDEIASRVSSACEGLPRCNPSEIIEELSRNVYEGIDLAALEKAISLAVRSKIEREPSYSYAAARLLLVSLYREVFGVALQPAEAQSFHENSFSYYLEQGIEAGRLSPELRTFNLKRIAGAIRVERDKLFQFMGLQTIYDRYLLHRDRVRFETPQYFWMRVAMGLAMGEKDRDSWAIEFYNQLSSFRSVSSTPTLFNAGTLHPQLSSCFLTTISDELTAIFKGISDNARLSKWAGGLGNDWTNVRALGARIKGTNGESQGVIPFLKVANDAAVAVNQGGKRQGAVCAYLETWHLDIEEFLELRKNTGDDRRRTHDMNTANWVPDLFLERVEAGAEWTLFSPDEVSDLHDLYGSAFKTRYEAYEAMAKEGKIRQHKSLPAQELWRKMLSMLFETGHPWITFKDPSNIRSPQDHVGVIHSSNLCTEILLPTSAEETAVCNLGSINLLMHVEEGKMNWEKLKETVTTCVRMLDNVIDLNFYPTPEARDSNLRHRPIGLGLMGFQDTLSALGLAYASEAAIEFSDESMEFIALHAYLASSKLAAERGAYPTFPGSKWSRDILPADSLEMLRAERGTLDVPAGGKADWSGLRAAIKKNGMRNSNVLAIAPTATISNIVGVSPSIEPSYRNLYVKSNLSGEFMVHNTYLVDDLKRLGMWDADMIDDLKYFDGSIMEIERIPDDLKKVYLTAFEIDPDWLIECGSKRQKWIDMGQSLNLYIAEPSGKKLHEMYMLAWRKGLKTTYYLRSLGATQIEKSTTDVNRRGLQPRWMKNKSASSDIQVDRGEVAASSRDAAAPLEVPKVCGLDGDCESCQ